MEKRTPVFTDFNVFTRSQTNCMGNVTHYQFDRLFEHAMEKWVLKSDSCLAEILRGSSARVFETHKKLGKSFFSSDQYALNIYLEREDSDFAILAADFVSEKTGNVYTSIWQKIAISKNVKNDYCVSATLRRGLLLEINDLVTLGETSCLKSVPSFQYDVLFGRTRETWALKVVSGLLQGLGEKVNLETVQTDKYQLCDFFVGYSYATKLYVEDLKNASFVLSVDFVNLATNKTHVVMQQKIAATDATSGKIIPIPIDLKKALEAKFI